MNDEMMAYLMEIVPAAKVECAGCGVKKDAVATVIRANKFYCSDECADRDNAILLKAQPKGVKIGCFDV